ncbi:MAG: hypothetical protein ABFS09_05485 [Thermodesulfobacteriota bacterium]
MSVQDTAKTGEILEKLKSAILNIDWEISDENITLLNQELAELRSAWKGQKAHLIYLQILGALSHYIAANKENANPSAFPMLRNVFASLEEMVINPGDEDQQGQKVMEHVDSYNELKKAIAAGEAAPAAEPEVPPSEAEPEPEPEVAAQEESAEEQEEPSTINRLVHDEEDHTTDSIFDSMLDEMVQAESPDDEPETKPEPEPEPQPPPKSPPARPPVQAAYNKDDGTEIEADRNIADEFAEADELLDDFFVDDVAPPGGAGAAEGGGDEFDLSAFAESEEVLDLDEAGQEDVEPGEAEEYFELSLEEKIPAEPEVANELDASELEMVEDVGLDIFKVDDPEEAVAEPTPAKAREDFLEMEPALDDFFEGEAEAAPPQKSAEVAAGPAPEQDIDEVDLALDDFFEEDEQTAAAIKVDIPEPDQKAPEVAGETLAVEVATPVSKPAGTVEDLKSLLLSVDWEVDDQLLERVDSEISVLKENLSENHTALLHLNFLSTVIHHIGGQEHSQVISESMTCLKMVTESLENLLAGDGADESQYAAQAVSSFVDWHELVVAEFEKRLDEVKRQGGDLAESIEALELETGEGESTETQKLKTEILSEVRKILSQEMKAIRQELLVKD